MMTPAPLPQLLTINEVVTVLRRSRASIYRDVAAARLPSPIKLGSSSRWRRADIEAVVASGYRCNRE